MVNPQMASLNLTRPQRPARLLRWGFPAICLFGLLMANPARATPPIPLAPAETASTQPDQTEESAPTGFLAGLSRSNYLFGDMLGVRPFLAKYGITFSLSETSEVLGNVSGGSRTGADYDGLTQMDLQLDTQRALNLYGGTFNVSGLQIHGRSISAEDLDTLQTASGIEADSATRLWELWYQQKFLEEDRLDVKIGQQSLDQEFMVSQNALMFVNTMFGWPMLPSADMPGGGPAYPLSALGIRARYRPTDSLTFLVGVFNGSPVVNNVGDPQQQNPSGTSFPTNGGALVIGEMQYAFPALGAMVYPDQPQPLSGTYKLGFWYDTENFPDQEFDNAGHSLASLNTTGIPQTHRDDFAFYAVADQMIWRDPEDDDRNWNFFVRPMGTPLSDRNLIDFSLNAGFVMHEPIPLRDDDNLGIGMGYAHVSDRASDLDRDTGLFTNSNFPVRSGETYLELTYQYQLTPWCQLQPDFQYVFDPGGGASNPNAPTQKLKDEAVLGMRVNILF
jgi:porin